MSFDVPPRVTPTCCLQMQVNQSVFLYFEGFEFDVAERPKWYVKGIVDSAGFPVEHVVEAKCCPFCGTKVPEIVKSNLGDLKIHKTGSGNDSGYRCGTCKKRNRECDCLPPEFHWAPANDPNLKSLKDTIDRHLLRVQQAKEDAIANGD